MLKGALTQTAKLIAAWLSLHRRQPGTLRCINAQGGATH